jgi:hypothetical protein
MGDPGADRKSRKPPIIFVMSVCLSAFINAFPTGRICVIFDNTDFHENLSKNSKYGSNQEKKNRAL